MRFGVSIYGLCIWSHCPLVLRSRSQRSWNAGTSTTHRLWWADTLHSPIYIFGIYRTRREIAGGGRWYVFSVIDGQQIVTTDIRCILRQFGFHVPHLGIDFFIIIPFARRSIKSNSNKCTFISISSFAKGRKSSCASKKGCKKKKNGENNAAMRTR